jgi:polysaccharide chain length determinant protein (PEP-CTERM system associated)
MRTAGGQVVSSRTLTLDDIVRVLARRRWIVLLPFALGLAAVPLLARFSPERYRSETLIMVVPQRVPDSYVKPTVTESVEARLPSISDQILSRTRLERIIQDMDLYQEDRRDQVMEDVVARMRQDVQVTLVGKNENANSFRVSYVSHSADTAMKVTERLASLYIEQNLADRNNQAESTSQFLATQLEEAKRRLVQQEKKLEAYRKRHAGQLPTQMQANLQTIQNASLQLQALNDSTNRAQERRLLIERQIADTQAVPIPWAAPPPPAPDAPAPSTTAQRLDAARARLAASLQRYTPDHPEVLSLQRTVEELATRLDEETPVSATEVVAEPPLSPAEAMQKKKILDLQAELAVVDHQLTTNRTEEERLKAAIAEYQAKVDAAPSRESELVELTRDYSTLQTSYTTLLMKREDSVLAANLERRQIGEQFRILDPASRPEKPYNQGQRLAVMAAGAGLGLAFGLLIVGVKEYRDSSFRHEDEVHRVLSLPVLALIPMMTSEREDRAARRRARLMDVAGGAVLVAAIAVVVFWRFQSLIPNP